MTIALVIYLVGAVVVFLGHFVLTRSLHMVVIPLALVTALVWPFYAFGIALGFLLRWAIPDKS